MILLIDNYDSFSYNLFQMLGAIEPDIEVVRNDALTVDEIEQMSPDALIISPGPGRPADAGICEQAIEALSGKLPILGVCLGHQAICETFGATVGYANKLMHGKQSLAYIDPDCPLFASCPQTINVARYHSLAADEATIPECLKVTARTEDGCVMAVQHIEHPTFGVQFHPESIMTPQGETMLRNFVGMTKKFS